MANFCHRSSGDLNDILIDPAEDWSQVLWSRDHFPTRELIFNRFPRPNFEIAARGWPAANLDFDRKSGFSKIDKKLIWTHQLMQVFMQNTDLDSKSAQNRLGPDFDQFSKKSIYHAERNMGMKPSKIWDLWTPAWGSKAALKKTSFTWFSTILTDSDKV